jgi:hypothetical protein
MANDFKSFKVKLKGDVEMIPPEKEETKSSTRARASIVPHEAHPTAELDTRYGHPMPQSHTHTEAAESPFTSYKDKTKPSIFAPKSHSAKKTSTGTVYTKNWSKKDQETDDGKKKVKVEEIVNELKDPERDPGAGTPANFVNNENPSSSPVSKVKELAKNALKKVKSEMSGSVMGHAQGNQTNGY